MSRPREEVPMEQKTLRGIIILCVAVALMAGIASGIGVFMRGSGATETVVSPRGEEYQMVTTGVYRYNSQRMVAEGIGWDIFTLFAAVPALLLSLPWVLRGSLRARLFAVGILAYLTYQYLMYAVSWAFGPLFLLFIAIFVGSFSALVWIISTISIYALPKRIGKGFPRIGMGIFSLAIGILLIGMWMGRIIPALAGDIEGLLLGQTTLVVQALDLGIIVPLALFTAGAVLRRQPIGFVLAPVLAVKGAAMGAAICAMVIAAWIVEGVPTIVPLSLFAVITLVSLWLAFRIYRSIPIRQEEPETGAAVPPMDIKPETETPASAGEKEQ